MLAMVRVLAIVVGVALGAGAPAFGGRAFADGAQADRAQASRVDDARSRALTSAYQEELPRYSGTGESDGERSPLLRKRRPGERERLERAVDTRSQRARDPGPLGSLVSFLLWGVVIVMAVLLAAWLAVELAKRDDTADVGPEGQRRIGDDETAAIIERPLGDADELARRGEYAEAIHTLLLRTLQELVRSAAVRVERSHTSREILARVPLLADARDALTGLITAVELTHFGDEPANAVDYDRCREQFHRFATAFRASGLAGAGARAGSGTSLAASGAVSA